MDLSNFYDVISIKLEELYLFYSDKRWYYAKLGRTYQEKYYEGASMCIVGLMNDLNKYLDNKEKNVDGK